MELGAGINKYKNMVINIAIIIIALLIAKNIYKSQTLKVEMLQQKKEIEIKKNGVLADISNLEKKISSYKNFINKKEISSVINTINNFAQEAGLNISSVKPREPQEETDYTIYPFDLVVKVKDYHSLGRFISKLESSQDIYNIEVIKISSAVQYYAQANQPEGLDVSLTVSTVLLK